MADEIKLTLNPFEDENKQELDSAVQAAVQATEALEKAEDNVQKEVQQATLDMQNFSDEEQQMIDEFSEKIDVRDSNLVFSYGAAAQQNISQFSDAALKNVQTKDLDEVGNMIANLVVELKNFDTDDEEKGGLFGLFKKKINNLEMLKARYDHTEINVNKIVQGLEQHQIQLLKDIAMLDKLYDQNLVYFKELSMYIVAGKKRLESFRANEVEQARAKAAASGLPEDAQAAKDLADKADRFEKKLYDLELTRNISIQMAPQIRLIQSSNQIMAEKIQTSLVNTIPLWKSQMVLALGLAHTENAMKAQRAVTDLTNDLLTKNAEKLHMATVETAKEAERGMVDIETLKHTNKLLIDTMDEVLEIQQQGKEKRRAAEQELANIEGELRAKILEPLQEHFGVDISEKALLAAIDDHNAVSAIIEKIGEHRKMENPNLTGYEFHVIQLVSQVCPHDLILPYLEETLEELKTREPDEKPWRARVLLVGSEVDDSGFVKLIEECGAFVCADRFCFGSLPGRTEIALTDGEDALTQVCRHYIRSCQCPRMMNQEKVYSRKQYVADLAKEYGAEGIIYQQVKFCDPWAYERMLGSSMLQHDYGYPVLSVDRPYNIASAGGQMRTRVQAFVESIEIKKIQKGGKA